MTPRSRQRKTRTSSASTARRSVTSRAVTETASVTCRRRKIEVSCVVDEKQAAAIMDDSDDEITGAVIEHGNQQPRVHLCRDCVFAKTECPSLGNHAVRWKGLVVLMIITIVQELASAFQENDVWWILGESRIAGTSCHTDAHQEVPSICRPKGIDWCQHEPKD